MSWLNEIVAQHEELESPLSFWWWAAIASISAVMKDSVYLDKYLYKLYPNIYVMLHADSGIKKGPPISMAKQLVNAVGNTRVFTGRSSIQGILKELGTAYTKPGGFVITKAVGFICSSELTSSLVEDKVATTILTDLFDRQYNEDNWKSLLKMETFTLKDPTITALTATNEAHAEEFFLKKDVQGGFFARTFIIYENQRNKINSLMYPLKTKIDYKESAKFLKTLALLQGPFDMEPEAREYHHHWYVQFTEARDKSGIKDPTGTLNRFDDSVLKVAMLVALGHTGILSIKVEHVKEAIEKCEKLIGNVRRTTLGRGRSSWAQEKALVINELLNRSPHIITRQQLNKLYWMHANVNEWDEIMESLRVAGIVTITQMGNQLAYEIPEAEATRLKNHLRGK